jgi:SAM-dependent methyltransferase
VDRDSPRFYNLDYWPLQAIRRALDEFLQASGEKLRGGIALDFGAVSSPYARRLEHAGLRVLMSDIGDVPAGVLKISDVGRVPLEDASVDLVVSTQVLEHVPEVTQYLLEALRVLKPGGVLFLSTHGTWHLHRVPTDMRRWTIDGLGYEVERAGFEVERVEPYVGRLATVTYQRMAAFSEPLRGVKLLAPLRAFLHVVGNARMAVEEMCTTPRGREALQQLVVVTATKPIS